MGQGWAVSIRAKLPVPNPANASFGGPNLDRLFVLSARSISTVAGLEHAPLSCALFGLIEPAATGVRCQLRIDHLLRPSCNVYTYRRRSPIYRSGDWVGCRWTCAIARASRDLFDAESWPS